MENKAVSLSMGMCIHNEAEILEKSLSVVKDFCDEIVVLLDRSTDGSKQIAEKYGAKIIEGSFEEEGNRKNTCVQACSKDWILFLDADEEITPELAQEIKQVIQTSKYDWHSIPFDNYIGQKRVRYGWGCYVGVGAKPCLFKKDAITWLNEGIHSSIKMSENRGPILKNRINHYIDKDISDFMSRIDRYSTATAKDIVDGKIDGKSFAKNIKRIFTRFFKCYVSRKGYKEGIYGFLISLGAGLYPIMSYIKSIEHKEKLKND